MSPLTLIYVFVFWLVAVIDKAIWRCLALHHLWGCQWLGIKILYIGLIFLKFFFSHMTFTLCLSVKLPLCFPRHICFLRVVFAYLPFAGPWSLYTIQRLSPRCFYLPLTFPHLHHNPGYISCNLERLSHPTGKKNRNKNTTSSSLWPSYLAAIISLSNSTKQLLAGGHLASRAACVLTSEGHGCAVGGVANLLNYSVQVALWPWITVSSPQAAGLWASTAGPESCRSCL